MNSNLVKPKYFNLPADVFKALQDAAFSQKRTQTAVLCEALREYFRRMKEQNAA